VSRWAASTRECRDQCRFRRTIAVDRRLSDAGARSDVVHFGGVISVFGECGKAAVQDRGSRDRQSPALRWRSFDSGSLMCLAPIGYTVSADSLLVSEHDLQSRPSTYTRQSIDAHLTIVLTAWWSATGRVPTRWSIKKFVCTPRLPDDPHPSSRQHSQHRHDQEPQRALTWPESCDTVSTDGLSVRVSRRLLR